MSRLPGRLRARAVLALVVVVLFVLGACDDGPVATPAREVTAAPYLPPPTATTASPRAPAVPLTLVLPPFDVVSTEGALDNWPRIVPGVEAHAFTSHDRGGGNDDGFSGAHSELYTNERGEHVIFDALGPGVLRTLWFTSNTDGNGTLFEKKLRFYFDDERSARFTIDANELFSGGVAPFVRPLVADNQSSTGGFVSWVPLVFARRLVVTTEVKAGFYQAHYETFPPDWIVPSTTIRSAAPALVERFTKLGFSELPRETVDADTAKSGAGILDVLHVTPSALDDPTPAELAAARIRIWFDGATKPQVDVPLTMFFGAGFGDAVVRAIPWTTARGGYESTFPMPYWEGFRLQITGLPAFVSIHTSPPRWPRGETGTFTAIASEAKPTVPGADFVYADVIGAGKIAGMVLTVEPRSPTAKQWWEGDMRTMVDDLASPSIHGTGHEDDFLGGWSNEFFDRPFTLPMHGVPKTELLERVPGTQYNAKITAYRLFPGITFLGHVRHSTEHGPANMRDADYESATFLYHQARSRLLQTDERARVLPTDTEQEPLHLRIAHSTTSA